MLTLPRSTISEVPKLPAGWHLNAIKVLSAGRLALVGTDADLGEAEWRRDFKAVLPRAEAARCRVWVVDNSSLTEGVEFDLLAPFPLVDQFSDGRWLVAGARVPEGNARIFGADGVERAHFELGDGIAHLKVDGRDQIWVGWTDEGIFENGNWRVPHLKHPPSSSGVAAFDGLGKLIKRANIPSIADCYALNVFGDEAWACTYPNFPITRLDRIGERAWSTKLKGTTAIAVDCPYVLAAGGYDEARDHLELLELDGKEVHSRGQWRLPLTAGPSDAGSLMDGRGGQLHVVRDGQWHRWLVADFVASSRRRS